MKVAYIGIKGLPARGGAERVVEAIVTRMPENGITPVVYCDKRYTPADTNVEDVKLIRISTLAGKHTRQISLNVLSALHAVLFGGYDLIHLHHTEASFILPLLRLRYKVVSTSHGSAYRTKKWGGMARFLMRLMDWPFMKFSSVSTFVSSVDAKRLSAKYKGKVEHIPNGVSADQPCDLNAAREIQKQYSISSGEYIVFVAGRIEPIKGAHLAIEAHKSMAKQIPLLIIGDNTQVPAYGQMLIDSAGSNVIFHPPISNPSVLFGLMADARFLVFPSLVEAMSMVLLEAASLGVPIIASDIPENVAAMQDDALYFQSDCVDSLANKMAWALDHPEKMQEIAQAARERVHKENSWQTIAGQYFELYQSVIK